MTKTNKNKKEIKQKVIAILLAIFLGPFTWLYTMKEDQTKFIIGLLCITIGWLFIFPPIVAWIWAVVDTVNKKDSDNYKWE